MLHYSNDSVKLAFPNIRPGNLYCPIDNNETLKSCVRLKWCQH